MGWWKKIKNAAKSVGKFVKKNWKAIVGVAAAVAVPFIAGPIAAAIGGSQFLMSTLPATAAFLKSAGGAALVGAGLGAASAGITGGNPLLGAALGGIGAYGVSSAGGLSGMFGGIGGGATGAAPAGAFPAVRATGGIIDIGAATGINAATGAAVTGAASSLGSIGAQLATNPQAIGALGQLAMTMFNKDLQELTPEEEAQLREVAAQAATNRSLFEQQVMEANKMINAGTPNPEQAYANARFSTENQLAQVRRDMPVQPGVQETAARQAAIAGAQSGTLGVAVDYASAMDRRRAGVQSLPTEAPKGYNQLAMGTYEDLYSRRQKLQEQQSKALGNLFGSIA